MSAEAGKPVLESGHMQERGAERMSSAMRPGKFRRSAVHFIECVNGSSNQSIRRRTAETGSVSA